MTTSATAAQKIVRLDSVDSTQLAARALLDDGAPDGTIVVARRQTAGRGRLGRSWLAPDDGLFMSLVHRPASPLPARFAPRITLLVALGLLRAFDALGVRASVKWPNDVVIPGAPAGKIGPFRKIAGVLVEMHADAAAFVIGVGVNVRAPASGWPSELALTAGALADAGYTGDADDVLERVRAALPPALAARDDDDRSFARALDELRARSALLGRRVEVDGVSGEARALDEDGALIVVDDAGESHTIRAGDVWPVSPGLVPPE